MKIANAVVLINSAGSPLGRRLATHFSHQNATLVLVDRDPFELQSTCELVDDAHCEVVSFVLADYSQSSISDLMENIEQTLGRGVDILLNNLQSTGLPELTSEHSAEDFTRGFSEFSSKLYGFGHAITNQMRKNQTRGVIVNVISNDNIPNNVVTDTSMIVNSVTKTWAKELGPFNIRVGSVVPGETYAQDSAMTNVAKIRHELIRNTEYVVANDYFNGRVVSS